MTAAGGSPVIDMHMHLEQSPSFQISAEWCIEAMDRAGVDTAVVMTLSDVPGLTPGGLELVADACKRYAGRLLGLARINPAGGQEAMRLFEHAVTDLGFVGLKQHPVSTMQHPGTKATIDLVRRAGELGVPTLFHCGDEHLTTPLQIEQAVKECPESTVILGHMGGYFHTEEAIQVAERNANVVLETSAMPYPEKILEAVNRIGADRVVFGSDGPIASPVLEKQKVIIATLPEDQQALVLGGNAARMLGVAA